MNVILTGGTGFVGGEVLSQLVANPVVDQVTCFTRRPIAAAGKVISIVHYDFTHYSDAVLDQISPSSFCIWAMGGKTSDIRDVGELERVTHRFTLAFARAVCDRNRLPFRFYYVSGMGADPTEASWFPWERDTRQLKGRTERDMHGLAQSHPGFSEFCFRPGGILAKGSGRWTRRILAPLVIGVEDLAAALIRVAIQPEVTRCDTLSNGQIKRVAFEGRPAAA